METKTKVYEPKYPNDFEWSPVSGDYRLKPSIDGLMQRQKDKVVREKVKCIYEFPGPRRIWESKIQKVADLMGKTFTEAEEQVIKDTTKYRYRNVVVSLYSALLVQPALNRLKKLSNS